MAVVAVLCALAWPGRTPRRGERPSGTGLPRRALAVRVTRAEPRGALDVVAALATAASAAALPTVWCLVRQQEPSRLPTCEVISWQCAKVHHSVLTPKNRMPMDSTFKSLLAQFCARSRNDRNGSRISRDLYADAHVATLLTVATRS